MNNRKIIAIVAIVVFVSGMVLAMGTASAAKPEKDLELKFSKKNSKGTYLVVKNVGKKKTPATKVTLSYFVKEKTVNKDYKVKSLKSGQSVNILIPAKTMKTFKATKNNQKGKWAGSISLVYTDNRYSNNLLSIYYGKVGDYTVNKAPEKA